MLLGEQKRPMVEELPDPPPGPGTSTARQVGITRGKDGMSRLAEMQVEEIATLSKKIELFTTYQDDYEQLKKLIDKMQDKVKHPHRIPIAGDNYFALRSSRQSNQIINRRLEDIRRKLKATEEARKKTQGWLDASEERLRDKEEFVEIIETM